MNDFLSFRKMITPMAIQVLFWIGVAASTILGITRLATSYGAAAAVINGLLVLFLGPIVVRVICELIMMQFGIHRAILALEKEKNTD